MSSDDRVKRYAQIGAVAAVLVWGALWYGLAVAPKARALDRLDRDTKQSGQELAAMRKEIEDARLAGPPPTGASRFEKFGILGSGEEQLFLSDLIDLCTETRNTLDLVRRSDVARPAATSLEQGEQSQASAKRAGAADEAPQVVIRRVPHTVSFSGTFLSSFLLLRRLEEYKRLLTVERMEVATDAQAGHPSVNGNITIDLYLVEEPAPASPSAEDAHMTQAAR